MGEELGLEGAELLTVANTLHTLYSVFRQYDAFVVEINPFVRTPQEIYLSLDAKVEIDDSSLYRHPNFQAALEDHIPNPLERRGSQIWIPVRPSYDMRIRSAGYLAYGDSRHRDPQAGYYESAIYRFVQIGASRFA